MKRRDFLKRLAAIGLVAAPAAFFDIGRAYRRNVFEVSAVRRFGIWEDWTGRALPTGAEVANMKGWCGHQTFTSPRRSDVDEQRAWLGLPRSRA